MTWRPALEAAFRRMYKAAEERRHFVCSSGCGAHVKADEDGCCVHCGADCVVGQCLPDCNGNREQARRDADAILDRLVEASPDAEGVVPTYMYAKEVEARMLLERAARELLAKLDALGTGSGNIYGCTLKGEDIEHEADALRLLLTGEEST